MIKNRGIKNIISAAVGQAAAILTGLVVTRVILVCFGSAVNGLLNSVNQIFTYFILLEAGVGAASLQALYKPAAADDRDGISSIMAATKRYYDRMGIVYAVCVAAFAAVYAILMRSSAAGDGISAWTMAGVILIVGCGNVINFIYQGKYKILMQAEGRNYVVTNAQTMLNIIACVGKCAAMLLGAPVLIVMACGLAANLIQTAYYIYYINKNYSWLNMKAVPAQITQKESVMVHQASQLIFQNTDVLILTIFCGLKVVSVYAAFKIVVTALSSLTFQLSESVLYALGQKYATDADSYKQDIDRFDVAYTMVSFALFSVALILYRPFMVLYTEGIDDISYDMPLLPLLFVAIELISGYRRAMQNTINVAGHFKATVPRTIAESVINIAVSLALVRPLGIYGVLIGTIAALLYRSNDIIIYGNKKILGRSAWGSYKIYIVNTIAFIPALLAYRYVAFLFSGYGGFILAGIMCLLIVGAWYLIVNYLFFKKELKGLKNFR